MRYVYVYDAIIMGSGYRGEEDATRNASVGPLPSFVSARFLYFCFLG